MSAGYHGYWITDFTQIDPHLGTNADMRQLITLAHKKGMKVFFDIITNHTADVIRLPVRPYGYIPKSASPYKDANATSSTTSCTRWRHLPAAERAGRPSPNVPVFKTPADATVKQRPGLNDPTLYHNRGDSTFAGESAEYGDFVGLDDLFTEQPRSATVMIDVYKTWAELGIDGLPDRHRQAREPGVLAEVLAEDPRGGQAKGTKDFFMFGEVYDADPKFMSTYTTAGALQATLDFGSSRTRRLCEGDPSTKLRDLLRQRRLLHRRRLERLPTADLPRQPRHGPGRHLHQAVRRERPELLQRDELAHSLMYLTRGQPVIYYGDEQGFTVPGGDKDARQDMFATKTADYTDDEVVDGTGTTTIGSKDRFDTSSPMYKHIAGLAKLRAQYPTLADGTQVHRLLPPTPAGSTLHRSGRKHGVLVIANNATTDQDGHDPHVHGERPLQVDLRRRPAAPGRRGGSV